MTKPSVEYVGFSSTTERREYRLRLRIADEIREYTVGIVLGAFTSGRARYQDGPEIAYLKLSRELLLTGGAPAEEDFTVSEVELTDYRDTHTVARNRLSPSAVATARPPVPATT
jgi:hypothetical protein